MTPAASEPFPHIRAARPIELGAGVRIDPPFVLAPMEGVTHEVFRDVILDLAPAGPPDRRPLGPGAAWTEFVRVTDHPRKTRHLVRDLGAPRRDPPVGLQLMGTDPDALAATAVNAVEAGAPMLDLNFGCPAKGVFGKCAGSALLAHPDRMHALVRAVAEAVPIPVTAKIRVGVDDESLLEEIVAAVDSAGAAMLSVHARTKADGYVNPARWELLARVRAMTKLPLLGNGDVLTVADAERMLATTGVDGVMIGRGTLRDPWILAKLAAVAWNRPPPTVGRDELQAFHARYRDDMLEALSTPRAVLGQLKQIYRRLDVGIPIDEPARRAALQARSIEELEEALGLAGSVAA